MRQLLIWALNCENVPSNFLTVNRVTRIINKFILCISSPSLESASVTLPATTPATRCRPIGQWFDWRGTLQDASCTRFYYVAVEKH